MPRVEKIKSWGGGPNISSSLPLIFIVFLLFREGGAAQKAINAGLVIAAGAEWQVCSLPSHQTDLNDLKMFKCILLVLFNCFFVFM